jgi:chorismate dehydratase
VLRVASVAYVNAKPLVEGLAEVCDLSFEVPSRLLGRMQDETADVGLLPTIDLLQLDRPVIVPSGGIGCDGPTLTVRLFAKRPLETVTSLAVDPDSHTSVALSRIIFKRRFGFLPHYLPLSRRTGGDDEALLLIGDKVITEEPADYRHQLDLGLAWKELTGRPFVFAVWAARRGVDLGDLPDQLTAARQRGMSRIDQLVRDHAVPAGWPADVARRYYTSYLRYDIGPDQLEAIDHFHKLAAAT